MHHNMQTPCIIFVEQHFNWLLLELVKFQNVTCNGNKGSSGHLFVPSRVGNDMNFIVKQGGELESPRSFDTLYGIMWQIITMGIEIINPK